MSRETDANDSTVNRRSVLKAVGASAVAGVSLAGSATAESRPIPEELERVRAEFDDPVTAREAVAEHADTLLEELAERGVLATASASAFPSGELQRPDEYSDATEGATVRGVRVDDAWDAEVATSTETDAHAVELVVQPNRGRSYAIVAPKDADDTYRLTSEPDDDEVRVSNHCHHESRCLSPFACQTGTGCQRQQRHCCDDDGDGTAEDCTDWYNDRCCAIRYCG